MRLTRWRPILLALAFVLVPAACTGDSEPTATPSPTSTPSAEPTEPPRFVAEHIGLSSDDAVESCVEIEGASILGRAALEAAWNKATVKTDDRGRVCGLESIDACGGRGRWRHYIVDIQGMRRVASLDPDEYRVEAGELDAWLYNAPGDDYTHIGIDFATVCEDQLAGGPG